MVGAIVGYRLIHALAGVMSLVSGITLALAFIWVVVVNGLGDEALNSGGFTWVGFMGTVSLAALWQIAYAPYVSDYTRYMPRDTGVRPAFWATYAGCVSGSLLPMVLGALVGAALPEADTVTGLSQMVSGIGTLVIAVFGIGIAATNAMNLYCGALSTITVGQTLVPSWLPRASSRAVVAVVLFCIALVMAIAGQDNFLVNFTNFMLLLLCVLVPWTAVNLVDYYVIKHGRLRHRVALRARRRGLRALQLRRDLVLLHRHPDPAPVPEHHDLHRMDRARVRRCRRLLDRRAGRDLPAVLRPDAQLRQAPDPLA